VFARLSMERLTDDDSVIRAITEPPKGPGPGSGAPASPNGPTRS